MYLCNRKALARVKGAYEPISGGVTNLQANWGSICHQTLTLRRPWDRIHQV
jgi:hypothetical protein